MFSDLSPFLYLSQQAKADEVKFPKQISIFSPAEFPINHFYCVFSKDAITRGELFTCAFEHFKCSTTSPNVTFSIIVFPDLSFTSYRFETTVFASSQCPARNVFIILAFHSGTSLVFHFAHQSSSSTMRPMRSQKPLSFSLQVSHICSSLLILLICFLLYPRKWLESFLLLYIWIFLSVQWSHVWHICSP